MATIIVIEDDADLRQILVDELEDAGHQVLDARNGVEGLEAIKASEPDVIVSDIGMPEMDGYQLRKRLQTCPRFSATPFFFVSALAFQQAIDKGMRIGADAFLTKPVDFDVLLDRITAAVA
ncbi:MAG: response regulator [Alphaproteobacteria bacterium]